MTGLQPPLTSRDFRAATFENRESRILAVFSLIVLSIFLRRKDSP